VRQDILSCYPAVDPNRVHVIHNGIDPEVYKPQPSEETLDRFGHRQDQAVRLLQRPDDETEGVSLLLAAALKTDPRHQLVMVPSSPDTPELAAEVNALAERVRKERGNLIWIDHFISLEDLIHLHSSAGLFICPSIYEPFGLVILEAMACETAVVASKVGGIPEIIVEGETGYLVDYNPDDTEAFTTRLAARIDEVMSDPALAKRMGKAGRERAVETFGWPKIAGRTLELYRSLLG